MDLVELRNRLRNLDHCVPSESLGETDVRILRGRRSAVDGSKDSLFEGEGRRCQIPTSKEISADLRESFSLGLQHLPMRFRDVELSDLDRPIVIDRKLDRMRQGELGQIISGLLRTETVARHEDRRQEGEVA